MSSSALYGRQGGSSHRSLRDEIREVVREEMAALDRRLLACERVSDTNAVTVQQLREHVGQSLHSARDELEARFASQLADAVARRFLALADRAAARAVPDDAAALEVEPPGQPGELRVERAAQRRAAPGSAATLW